MKFNLIKLLFLGLIFYTPVLFASDPDLKWVESSGQHQNCNEICNSYYTWYAVKSGNYLTYEKVICSVNPGGQGYHGGMNIPNYAWFNDTCYAGWGGNDAFFYSFRCLCKSTNETIEIIQ